MFHNDRKSNAGTVTGDSGLFRFNPTVSQPSPDWRGLWPVVELNDWCCHHTGARGGAPTAAE